MNLSEMSTEQFVQALAGSDPVPGGGGAAALVGAVGVALGNMVGSLTVGKKKYADVQERLPWLKARGDTLMAGLLELMQRDAEVFEPLSRAYGMPRETEAERAARDEIMQAALLECAEVPLQLMNACGEAIDLLAEYAEVGAAIAISDVGVGVACCRAALQSASLNVYVNTKLMKDRALAEQLNGRARTLLDTYKDKAERIFADVEARLV